MLLLFLTLIIKTSVAECKKAKKVKEKGILKTEKEPVCCSDEESDHTYNKLCLYLKI